MDPDAFSVSLIKWDPRAGTPAQPQPPNRLLESLVQPVYCRPREIGGLEDLFQAYGVRYFTVAKMAELGFTVNTLLNMKDEELDEMMLTLFQVFRWELLVGERYGIKSAVRAERRRLIDDEDGSSRRPVVGGEALDALSQEGLSEEPVLQEKEAAVSGGRAAWEAIAEKKTRQQHRRRKAASFSGEVVEEEAEDGEGGERQREHPFIVTEPGEVARGKKNGLDYLFHLYEQCRDFLIQVQNVARDRGEKCPTKVTNQVFRYAKKAGANYINKPKMRHYVHCYALHCLDPDASNALRKAYKERGENVGAWRNACYKPLVAMASRQAWDIDAIFNSHHRLAIWYVPTKLRQLCHVERSSAASSATGPRCCPSY